MAVLEAHGLPHEHAPKSSSVSAQVTLLLDGDTPDVGFVSYPASCTVTVTRGATTISTGAADRTDNVYAYEFTTPADLGPLTVSWDFAGATVGDITQTVEVVDRRACTMADLNAVLGKAGTVPSYPEAARRVALQLAIEAFEREARQVFTRRQTTETIVTREAGEELVINGANLRELVSLTCESWSGTVADIDLDDDALIGTWFPAGTWTAVYEHGPDYPPADVPRAIALIASSILADGPWDDRGYAVDDGTGLMRLLTAGVSGAAFSIPEVESALQRHRDPWAGA